MLIVPLYLIRCLIVKPTWLRSSRTKFVPLCPVVTLWFWLVLIIIIIFYPQVETLCNYHVGETVLSLQKATLIPGGSESLVYTTLSGGIGMLVPFTSREVGISCDQHPFSPSNINAWLREKVMRNDKRITKGEMLWSFIKFSLLILLENVWRSVWRICMWISGLKISFPVLHATVYLGALPSMLITYC